MRYAAYATIIAGSLGLLCTGCAAPAPLRVMSFNLSAIANDEARDGWPAWRAQIVDEANAQQPDILALQGARATEVRELDSLLKDYDFAATGSADGHEAGECAPLFYRRGRFFKDDAGHFWLSPTPTVVGSVGWDAAGPSVVTWVALRLKDAPLTTVRVLNTCFDEQGPRARVESAKLLRKIVESYGGRPLVVVGMFHCPPGSEPYRILTEDRRNRLELRDAHPADQWRDKPALALTVRRGGHSGRCDRILYNRGFEVEPVTVDRKPGDADSRQPVTPGPVEAVLRLAVAQARDYT